MKKLPALIAFLIIFASCSTPKRITYFQDADQIDGQMIAKAQDLTVQPNDEISIIVHCKTPELTALFNLPIISQSVGLGSAVSSSGIGTVYSRGISGYTIDRNGEIDFPVLGRLKIGGMTRSQISRLIKDELASQGQASDAVVTVEFLNQNIQVLGEVAKPGRYAIDKDAYTLADALSAAGDLTIFGQREDVRVIRNNNGKEETYKVDLTSARNFLDSPAYYLKQNDIIYVTPNDMRKRQSTVNGNNVRTPTFWMSLTSLASTVTLVILRMTEKSE